MIEKTSAGMNHGMITKLITVLEATLSKLSRYDEGSLIGSILSLTVFVSFNPSFIKESRSREHEYMPGELCFRIF